MAQSNDGTSDSFIDFLIQTELSVEVLLDEVLTLIFAGYETTSMSLAWILADCLRQPHVVRRIGDELETVLDGEPIESRHFSRLPYLNAVIQEGLRTGRRVPFTALRRVKQDFRVEDHVIPKGALIAVGHYTMCQREDVFPHPSRFDPDRFLSQEGMATSIHPFGHGARMCAGKGLASVELAVVLATLFQRASMRLPAPVAKAQRHGFMFAPENGLRIVFDEPGRGLARAVKN